MNSPSEDEEKERLLRALHDLGFTPKVRDVGRLSSLYADADEPLVDAIDLAISRVGVRAVAPLRRNFDTFPPRVRARVCRVVSKIEGGEARELLLHALKDADPKTQRNAIIGLGRHKDAEVEAALLALCAGDPPVEQKRSLAASLGKVGGEASLAWLLSVELDDPEFTRIRDRARLMLERTVLRKTPSRVVLSRAPLAPLSVLLYCRRGLEECVMAELGPRFAPREERPGVVRAMVTGPLSELLSVRTAMSFSVPLRARPMAGTMNGTMEDAVSEAIAAPETEALLRHFTEGAIRYRLSFAEGGHQRALVWAVAKGVAERAPGLINDPTESTWELTVHRSQRGLSIEASPRAFEDPRFAYRVADVPAASHPTIAAALALVARVKKYDVVWDPFTGSGTELIECGLRAPGVRLIGSDHDPVALERARLNLDAAKLTASLSEADALRFAPEGLTLIITNPPLGRRVAREASLGPMLDTFVDHAARLLAPEGRLVWLAPFADRSRARGERAGLDLALARDVDLGGFTAEMQVWEKRD